MAPKGTVSAKLNDAAAASHAAYMRRIMEDPEFRAAELLKFRQKDGILDGDNRAYFSLQLSRFRGLFKGPGHIEMDGGDMEAMQFSVWDWLDKCVGEYDWVSICLHGPHPSGWSIAGGANTDPVQVLDTMKRFYADLARLPEAVSSASLKPALPTLRAR
ncbi:MAG: hypothetical protein KDJ49_03795 [Alphaproteobacteria bacterium]|nr:hypothetical protein [Alphaproteobacteria bacterium]